ncbi:MAG: alpha-amylase family protein [Myxococcaceae bacterium]
MWLDRAGRAAPRIVEFTSPRRAPSGRIEVRLGEALSFELSVEPASHGDARAELWTNANHNGDPARYEAVPMPRVRVEGERAVHRVELPITRLGNYRATGRISAGGGLSWASEHGFADLLFRPRPAGLDALEIETVSVHNVNCRGPDRPGTFADLLQSGSPLTNGRYTLEWLAELGKNCLCLLPIFEISDVDLLHPADDLPSPYAVRNFFFVRPSLARSATGLHGPAAREAAGEEFLAFAARARELGLKLLLDLPLNHLGKGHEFMDLFERPGESAREVRSGDFSNLELPLERRLELEAKLRDPRQPRTLEYLAPWMFGSVRGDPRGAPDVSEIAPGGWFEWFDTLQLNHGRKRVGFKEFEDMPASPEHGVVRSWLGRVLSWWAVEMGVDGFRLDHLSGLPPQLLEETFNRVQADVDRLAPGREVLLLGEDFDTVPFTQHWVDALQCGWADDLVRATRVADFERILEHPQFSHALNVSSHDEERLFFRLRDDPRAAVRLGCLLHLLGGPVMEVAGDCFGEPGRVAVRRHESMMGPSSISSGGRSVYQAFARCLQARRSSPALQGCRRAWLRPRSGTEESELLALARHPPGATGRVVFVFCNLSGRSERAQLFALDGATVGLLEPERLYQVRDLLAGAGDGALWPSPLSGAQLAAGGIYARLAPYQLQALELCESS